MTLPSHALITGASSGIGAAIAREYARRGKPLVLTARRADRLDALTRELGESVPCHVIVADLAVRAAPQAIFAETESRGIFVDTLVNNAGYGVPGAYLSSDWAVHAEFLQVMVNAVCELTWLYLPAMRSAGRGRILNIASLAGLIPATAGHTLYGPAKSFLIRFSESLAAENRTQGVNVTALCPGMTYTEFHDVNGMRERVSRLPASMWMRSDEVARIGVDAVERGQTRMVPGASNKLVAALSKYLPERLADRIVNARARDYRSAD